MKYIWLALMVPVFAAYYLLGAGLIVWVVEWIAERLE